MSNVLSLPKSWVQVTVADLGKVVSGGTPSTKENSYWGGNISWISPSDLTGYCDKHIHKGAKSITQEGLKNSSATIMPAGSVHFSSRAPIGYTVISSCEMTTNQGFKSLVPAQGVFNEYIYYYLKSAKQLAESRATGTTFKEISGAAFSKLPVPLAPTNEQHRIVAKIEELFSELDKGIENLKIAQAQLKVYRQALLKHAFDGKLTAQWREERQANGKLSSVDEALKSIGQIPRPNRWNSRSKDTIVGHAALAVGNPGTPLPNGWHWVPMVDIARMESGHTPSRNHPEWWGGDIPWISIPDARKNHGGIITETVQMTNPQGIANSAARLLPASTVCVSRTASVGYVVELGKPMATSQDFVNWTPSAVVRPEWLRLVFGADREALLKFAKGTTHQTIYFPEWLSVHIALPSIEEQKKIIEEIESRLSVLEQTEQTIATTLQQAEALRQSILKRAFSGQLVAQDASDEPASVLLERIKAERVAQAAVAKSHKPKQAAAGTAPKKSNVIPFPVKLPNISATDLHAGILARAYQHHEHAPKYLPYFGHVKAEKIAHMVEAYLGIDLEREAFKDAAGPNDYPHLMKVESRARKANWFDVRKRKDADAYEFSKKHGFDALLLKAMKALGGRAEEVDALISLLLPLNSRQTEIVATLYAAWNNLLLQGQTPDDEAIVHEARENWHDSKLKIERDKFFRGLQWMREKGLVPSGKGRYVGAKTSPKPTRKPS